MATGPLDAGRRDLLGELLEAAQEDWVYDAWVHSLCLDMCPPRPDGDVDPDLARGLAVEVVCTAMDRGLLVAGTLTQRGFEQWDLTTPDAVARVRSTWLSDADPAIDLGAVAWFDLTASGEAWLEARRREAASANPQHGGDRD